jgi:hypothetical protein
MGRRGPTRTPDTREQHYEKIAALRLRRYSQARIAKELGITQQQVSEDLKELRKRWKTKQAADTEELIAEQVETLEMLFTEAIDAWQHSRTPKDLITHESGITPKGEIDKTIIRKDLGAGNSAFLQQAAIILDKISALKGIPIHVETSDVNRAFDVLTKEGYVVTKPES